MQKFFFGPYLLTELTICESSVGIPSSKAAGHEELHVSQRGGVGEGLRSQEPTLAGPL